MVSQPPQPMHPFARFAPRIHADCRVVNRRLLADGQWRHILLVRIAGLDDEVRVLKVRRDPAALGVSLAPEEIASLSFPQAVSYPVYLPDETLDPGALGIEPCTCNSHEQEEVRWSALYFPVLAFPMTPQRDHNLRVHIIQALQAGAGQFCDRTLEHLNGLLAR